MFALWEKRGYSDTSTAWLISSHHKRSLSYQAIADPGGATALADGSVLVIERAFAGLFAGVRVRLVRLSKEDLMHTTQAVLQGTAIFDATSRSLDNFEGLSSCQRHGQHYAVAISDNNGDWPQGINLQSTILMLIKLQSD